MNNSLYKIISRMVLMTALLALLLLVLNVIFTVSWLQKHPQSYPLRRFPNRSRCSPAGRPGAPG